MKNKLIYILSILASLVALSSCKSHTGSHSLTYDIDQPIDFITINWGFGNITFIQSDTFKLEEIAREDEEFIATPLSFEISSTHLTINPNHNNDFTQSDKHLNVYCDLNVPLQSLDVTAYFSILRLDQQNINQLNVKINLGQLFIKNCNIENATIFMPFAAYSSIEHSFFKTLKINSERVDTLAIHLIYNTIEKCDIDINNGIINIFYNNCKKMRIHHRYGKTIFRLRTIDCNWGYVFKVNINNVDNYHNEINFVKIESDPAFENEYLYTNPNGDDLNLIEINSEGEIHVWN